MFGRPPTSVPGAGERAPACFVDASVQQYADEAVLRRASASEVRAEPKELHHEQSSITITITITITIALSLSLPLSPKRKTIHSNGVASRR